MVWVKRILWGILGLFILVLMAGGAGYWYLTRHGGTEIHEAGLVGRFYAAPGVKHHTAVLMLGGSNGGYPYDKAAQNLADSGYPVFALAYFKNIIQQPAGVPGYLAEIPLEYFFHAIDWMKKRPEVNPDKIVLMGESRGGELVLLIASHRPDVAGVIAYSPSNMVWAGIKPPYDMAAWTLRGKSVPYVIIDINTFSSGAMLKSFRDAIAKAPPEKLANAMIPVENIHGSVLLISSKTDNLWPASQASDAVEARLKAHDFAYPVENVQYEDASHLLMGYGPGITKLGFPLLGSVYFGGSPEGTRKARNAGWAKAKEFLAQIQAAPASNGTDRSN
jgi:dienelactone hydrolase